MSFDAKPELADFNDQTIFLVYKPNPISNEGTLLRIGDATRNHHGLVVKPNEVDFRNSTDFDDTHYRYRYEKFPDQRAANAPVLDTQKLSLFPPTADVAERAAIPITDDEPNASTYQVLAVRSDSFGKKGAFRIDVDPEHASVFAHGRGEKRIKFPTAERVRLSQKGDDMGPHYNTVRGPALCVTDTGRIIAIGDSKRDSMSDASDGVERNPNDICYSHSDDHGKTWSRLAILIPNGATPSGKEFNKCGMVASSCLNFDPKTKTIWMLFCRFGKPGTLCVTKSTDNGDTWGFEDGDLYRVIDEKNTFRPGPASFVQIPHDLKVPYAGRMVVSCLVGMHGPDIAIWSKEVDSEKWERLADIPNRFTIQKSAPLGYFVAGKPGDETWPSQFNESTLFYCEANQTLYMSLRKHPGNAGPRGTEGIYSPEFGRLFLQSTDGGKTWSGPTEYNEYAIPGCQNAHAALRDVLFWFAPSGDHLQIGTCPSRSGFHCFASFDFGKTWDEMLVNIPPVVVETPYYKTFSYLDFAGYCAAKQVDENTVGVLVERGSDWANGNRQTYCNLTYYPFKIQYDPSMNVQKLDEITKGRTDVFKNGKKVASFDKRSDPNLLSTYTTKGEMSVTLGANKRTDGLKDFYEGEIAELIIFNKALSDVEVMEVNDYLTRVHGND